MKAVIFDCDGVLVDSEVIYKSSERQFLENVGLTYEPAEFFRRFMGRSEDSFFEEAGKDHLAKHGRPLPGNFRPDLLANQKMRFETELQAIAGINDMLSRISHVTRAVASSSPTDILNYKLRETGLSSYFGDHVYSAQQVRFGKPEPDLFLFAAERLGIAPEDCLVIEDSENGVLAGLAAGMTVVGFTGGGHCHDSHHESLMATGAHKIARDAGELQSLILDIFRPAPDARLSLA